MRKKERKEKSLGFINSVKKKLHKQAWGLMSEVVRREAKGVCFTCGKVGNWKEMHCGHFKHGKLDFDFRNLKSQCPKCNTYESGKLDVYGIKLVREYGIEFVNQLEVDAWKKGNDYSIEELKEIIRYLTKKLEDYDNN